MDVSNSTNASSSGDGSHAVDSVAVTALVVSLVALLITGVQLIQQLFGTAEGYRRCGKSVLGPWHVLRKRSWLWLEFRFETIFYTPHIELLPMLDGVKRGTDARGNTLYALNTELLRDHEGSSLRQARGRRKVLYDTVLESQRHGNDNDEPSEASVTWRRLLKAVHNAHSHAWPSTGSVKRVDVSEERESLPFVSIQKRTWDFMPDDIVRPLATTTVGTIAILAQRLGMRWRILDIPNGKLLADGNGYSLSSSQVDGLGLVLRFDAVEARTVTRQVIPSEASNQLVCSILPGEKTLVKHSYQLVDTRWPAGERDYSYESLNDIIGRNINMADVPSWTYNEMLILLCQFLPLPDCTATDITAYGFQSHGKSGLHWWETRFALMQRLKARIKTTHFTSPSFSSRLDEVLLHFQHLETYIGDFYLDASSSLIFSRKSARPKSRPDRVLDRTRKLALVNACRTIFDWTTSQLAAWNSDSEKEQADASGSEKTKYLDLVAAHARTSRGVQKTLRDWWKLDAAWQGRFLDSEDYEALQGKQVPKGRLRREGFVVGYLYADSITSHAEGGSSEVLGRIWRATRKSDVASRGSVVREFRWLREGEAESSDDVEVAWWRMMLRGVAWDMSVNNVAREDVEGAMSLPSSVYESLTPVWIT